ncbi:probable G-protein coupled receptor 160 [Boleophthalmus pectinirostris]|uniref:probable G-protein coupled receptor 160 n=1 Tax=Boleophthalmus pectinirostris TaxID=150288 RepID=UPI000A1C587B|nr:probable G-protein coupled receptor 160 [Boleophthalmus pectinirostris]
MDMSIPIPSVLFGLGGKCVLNWALVFFQKNHILRSFLCIFSLSVSVVDTILTLFVTVIHLLQDFSVLSWRLTQYHVCLLVQVLGYIYSAQHFFILVLTLLENLYVVLRRSQNVMWTPTWIFHLFLTLIVWLCSTLYVFKVSNIYPFLEDAAPFQTNNCWVSSSSVISEVATFVFYLLICFIVWHSLKHGIQHSKNLNSLITIKPQILTRLSFISKVVWIFLGTWSLFLIFLVLHVVLLVEMPSYLGLNCAWFCFINSLLIALALCIVYPSSELAQGLAAVPPDSFCKWKRRFRSRTDIA